FFWWYLITFFLKQTKNHRNFEKKTKHFFLSFCYTVL
ncbi:unnamed protein product, partial [Staurois parvus]